MRRLIVSLLIMATTVAWVGCRPKHASSAKGIGAGQSAWLDLSKVRDGKALEQLCAADDLVVFIGNAEKFGKVERDPQAPVPVSEDYLNAVRRYDAQKESWYAGKVEAEYRALLGQMAKEDPACAKIKTITPHVRVLAIMDGPGMGDSRVELTEFGRPSANAPWRALAATRSMVFDAARGLGDNPSRAGFELLMPRDAPLIVDAYTKSLPPSKDYYTTYVFRFVMTIIKGHGVLVARDSYTDLAKAVSGRIVGQVPVALLDVQGPQSGGSTLSPIRVPIWSPEAICAAQSASGAPDPACVAQMNAKVTRGFRTEDLGGCQQGALGRLESGQGDEKQGDEKQGDEKQGDEKQGLMLQGLGGLDDELEIVQGSKGGALWVDRRYDSPDTFAFGDGHSGSRALYAQAYPPAYAPSAVRFLGTGSLMGKGDTKALALPARIGADPSREGTLYPFRLPASAHSDLVLLDSCVMDPDRLDVKSWLSGRPHYQAMENEKWEDGRRVFKDVGEGIGTVIVNPFPLSADAVQYGALSLGQYYYLLSSVLADMKTERFMPLGVQQLKADPADANRRGELRRAMGSLRPGATVRSNDVYCSLYALPWACSFLRPRNGAYDTEGEWACDLFDSFRHDQPKVRTLCRPAPWHYDRCVPTTQAETLKSMNHALQTISAIDGALLQLRAGRPVPPLLHERVVVMLTQFPLGETDAWWVPLSAYGALPDGEWRIDQNPTALTAGITLRESLAVRQRYLETLRRFISALHLGQWERVPVDPFAFSLLEAAQGLLSRPMASDSKSQGRYAWYEANQGLGSDAQLKAGYEFMEALGGKVPARDAWFAAARVKLATLKSLEKQGGEEGRRRLLAEVLRLTTGE